MNDLLNFEQPTKVTFKAYLDFTELGGDSLPIKFSSSKANSFTGSLSLNNTVEATFFDKRENFYLAFNLCQNGCMAQVSGTASTEWGDLPHLSLVMDEVKVLSGGTNSRPGGGATLSEVQNVTLVSGGMDWEYQINGSPVTVKSDWMAAYDRAGFDALLAVCEDGCQANLTGVFGDYNEFEGGGRFIELYKASMVSGSANGSNPAPTNNSGANNPAADIQRGLSDIEKGLNGLFGQ